MAGVKHLFHITDANGTEREVTIEGEMNREQAEDTLFARYPGALIRAYNRTLPPDVDEYIENDGEEGEDG